MAILATPVNGNGLLDCGWLTSGPQKDLERLLPLDERHRPPSAQPMEAETAVRIGVISDTHGLLRPEAAQLLTNVEHILHAGDIGSADVIAALKRIAPTTAIRGNIDTGSWAKDLPETETVQLDGRTIHILHNLKELDRDPVESGFDAVISGHSHQPRIETIGGVLYLNPGSAGPRRFSLPIALATLELDEGAIRPKLHKLAA